MNPPAAMKEQQRRREQLMGKLTMNMKNHLRSNCPENPTPLNKPARTALVDRNPSQMFGIISRDSAWIKKSLEPMVIFVLWMGVVTS